MRLSNVSLSVDEVPLEVKVIVDVGMHRDELPQALHPSALIEMARSLSKTAHPAHMLPTAITGERGAETVPQVAYRLVADLDSAPSQQILHIPQRQREPDIR